MNTDDEWLIHVFCLGMLCQAILACMGDKQKIQATLELAGYVGGWEPNSKIQLKYVKYSLKAQIFASSLIDRIFYLLIKSDMACCLSIVDSYVATTNIQMNPDAADPAVFHRLSKPLVSMWNEDNRVDLWRLFVVC